MKNVEKELVKINERELGMKEINEERVYEKGDLMHLEKTSFNGKMTPREKIGAVSI